jgi:hypothetical protein
MTNPAPEPTDAVRAEYLKRLDSLQITRAGLNRRHRSLGIAKVALAGALLVVIGVALAEFISVVWVLAPLAAILVLAVIHERVLQKLAHCSRTMAFYECGLARIDNRWMGTGETGERFQKASHPYARDLDLFGEGSLYQLLSMARTRAGQEALAKWLLAPAAPETVRARQAAVAELRDRLDLREDLAVLAEEARALVPAQALAAWGEGSPVLASKLVLWSSRALAVLWFASLAAWFAWGVGSVALLVTAFNFILYVVYRARVARIVDEVESATGDLALLAGVLARLEREEFAAPRLIELKQALESQGGPPSRWIARLDGLMDYLNSRGNMVVKAIDPFVLWTLQCACAVEIWRAEIGPAVRRWLDTVGEFEALASLGGYAYEHPADVFPEFVETSPFFEAADLAHPLLSDRSAVRNDVRFAGELRVLIISGPNMAGKSTLVRAVGLNAILAQCGAPVRARQLRLSPLAVGASICVLDSLQGGISRFYAEIRRLKQIVDLTQDHTGVLFLLDEFLQGTNSHDRRLGAAAMVRSLVERGAIGLVTTHDLALAQIADELGSRAANAHFEDRLVDGKLVFDYRLQPGIVKTSNALNLMRSIGLDV